MMPSHAELYTCPHCGAVKAILALASGNTFGGTFWSDCRGIYPMLPTPSPVQRCQGCSHFYFLEDSSYETSDFYGGTQGELSWNDCLAALAQFEVEWQGRNKAELPAGAKPVLSKLSSQDKVERECTIRLLALHAFNDSFRRGRRSSSENEPSEKDWDSFRQNARLLQQLMAKHDFSKLLRVEILRELGEFDEAEELLNSIKPNRQNPENVIKMMREHIKAKDKVPFIISGDED